MHARQENVISRAFGSQDSVVNIQHDEEIEEASRQALAKNCLRCAGVHRRVRPGELVLVKAPFTTPDEGREWMWVEVIKWQGNKITGTLQNEPFNIPDLKAGQMVNVSEADVFDYLPSTPTGPTKETRPRN